MAVKNSSLPMVKEETVDQVFKEYYSRGKDYILQIVSQLSGYDAQLRSFNHEKAKNEGIGSFLINTSKSTGDNEAFVACGALVYALLDKTLIIPKVTQVTYKEVGGINDSQKVFCIEELTELASKVTYYNPFVGASVIAFSIASLDVPNTNFAGFFTYALIEREVEKEMGRTKNFIVGDKIVVSEPVSFEHDLRIKLAAAVKSEHYELAAQIKSELDLLKKSR